MKRGGGEAERAEDVVATPLGQVADALQAFTRRGIPWVALQERVPGPVVKFYGVTDGRFFNWYGSEAGVAGERPPGGQKRLQALAVGAAALLRLGGVRGGVALPGPRPPRLIDIHEWPSVAALCDHA